MPSKIEWLWKPGYTGETLNPIRARHKATGAIGWHCEKKGPGCLHCYSESANLAGRFRGTKLPYNRASRDKVELFLDEKTLHKPLHWKKPRMVFWADMTDMFGEWVPDRWLDQCFAVMALTPQHIHCVLTKWPERMAEWASDIDVRLQAIGVWAGSLPPEDSRIMWPLRNVWLGVSCENQAEANERIPSLLKCPAAVRFVSAEPLLEEINFAEFEGLDWGIVGGESGQHARPCSIADIRSGVEQFQAAGMPCFVKQLGSKPYVTMRCCDAGHTWEPRGSLAEDLCPRCWQEGGLGEQPWPIKHPKGGDPAEWPEDLRVRQWPEGATLVR